MENTFLQKLVAWLEIFAREHFSFISQTMRKGNQVDTKQGVNEKLFEMVWNIKIDFLIHYYIESC